MQSRDEVVSAASQALRTGFTLLCVATAVSAKTVCAQNSIGVPTLPGVLRGVVTDTLGNAISDAEVVLTQLRRQVRTRADGGFQFDSVKAGTYRVSARRLGYVARAYQVVVSAEGGSVEIRMIPIGYTIAAVTTTAEIGGLSGVIADTAFRALKDVQVTALGTGKSVRTDSAGAFFMPLKAGQYLLRIERDGFSRQTKSVMITEAEGRKIAAWLVPRSGPPNHFESNELFDLNQRIMRSSAVTAKFFTREELVRQGLHDLSALARNWANGRITSECDVGIGGVPNLKIPLSLLLVSEVEFVEVYMPSNFAGGGSGTRGKTSLSGNPTKFTTPTGPARPASLPSCGNLALVAWLRQ